MSAPAHLVWAKGGEASFVRADGDSVSLRSTIPSPPGSRIDGTLSSEPRGPVRVKIHGSKKQDDGAFILEGRLIDATREVRERIGALARATTA